MWVEKVNAAGGLKVGDKTMKVELIEYDYQSEGQRASQLAEKLINDDKVAFLFAPFGSGHTKIVAGVGERYQIPTIACVASSESACSIQTFKHLFGTLPPNGGMTAAMVKSFKEKFLGDQDHRRARARRRVPEVDGRGHRQGGRGGRA